MQGLFHVVRAVVAVDVAATLVADRYVVVVAAVLLALACVSDCVWRQSSVLTGVAIVVVVVVVVVVIAVSSSNSRSRISRHWQWY